MSTFNVEPYVEMAINSILIQTIKDFEFLIIDDASSDQTWIKLKTLACSDERIRLWQNKKNEGKAANMNRLLSLSKGKYVAYMDGDDIAVPERFEMQIKVLESGRADLCGGWALNFGAGDEQICTFPETHELIQVNLLFDWSLFHPTVTARRSILEKIPLRPETTPAADYDFYVRAAEHCKIYNMPVILLYRRLHSGQISTRKATAQVLAKKNAAALALSYKGVYPTKEELRLHIQIYGPDIPDNWDDVNATAKWFNKLNVALTGQPLAHKFLSNLWYKYCLKVTHFGLHTYILFKKTSSRQNPKYDLLQDCIIFCLSFFHVRYHSKPYYFLLSLRKEKRKLRKNIREANHDKAALINRLRAFQQNRIPIELRQAFLSKDLL